MRPTARLLGLCLTLMSIALPLLASCQSSVSGNETGSEPVNDQEANEYKKAIVRCYKTGGTRVVKIMGNLRCY